MRFVSEDGGVWKDFDFGRLPGNGGVCHDFAVAFEEATGVLGVSKRVRGAGALWQAARHACCWLDENRPGIEGLAALSVADAGLLAMSCRVPSGPGPAPALKTLLRCSPVVSEQVCHGFARVRHKRNLSARQPYSADEFRRINVVARAIVRRARSRLRMHWEMVADFRGGRFDHLPTADPRRSLAEVLDHCAREGDFPRTASGARAYVTRRAVRSAGGCRLLPLLHVTPGEAWAFGVLLAGLTGLNLSTLDALPAPHRSASSPDEPGIVFVHADKARRGRRSVMTVPVTALRPELRPLGGDHQRAAVLNTSLTTAYGVFMLLLELTEPARALTGSRQAFVYYSAQPDAVEGKRFGYGISSTASGVDARRRWMAPWLTGDTEGDQLLMGISMDRLRKTYLERVRMPTAHTPATLAGYLGRMDSVRTEGFHIVAEALNAQVAQALYRRSMTVHSSIEDNGSGQDAVLGSCADFEHSPVDGRRCRASFLACLDCSNARAFPRHLPIQLVVADRLRDLRTEMPIAQWITEYAGPLAQLEDIFAEYEPAQLDAARGQIAQRDHRTATLLLSGNLEAP
ncbi:hypothetical protein [Mycolicibacterium smegmatis]|nr:hypothetical protein [Mycolicibacterium smegmatis]MDF1902029.1 hypothetical protein [Mycolicibacterium smegmatis]MDF1908240.1 hypothetical protein [Mycolicibacterium smegmatis]MDF1920885.1 hypothetical protein [Mycolicibacterium smegmatis]MDF1926901.1 hypothetical protein [Mycolicibacterium smegmatis]UGT77848.1 hypothetical protein LTT02_13135 [Mycolicibacterium smegmatis]